MLQQEESTDRVGRLVVSTRAHEEAAALLRRTFPGFVLQVGAVDPRFLFRHSAVRSGSLVTSELMLEGRATAVGALGDDVVAAGYRVGGQVRIEYPRHEIDTTRPYLRPGSRSVVRMEDAHVRLVMFDRAAFAATAAKYVEQGHPVRLGPGRTSPVSDDAGRAWQWAAQRIHDTARDPRAVGNPIVTGELFDLGVRMVLACFAEPTDRREPAEQAPSPAAVRRAVAYLEEHADDAVAIPEVAAAARVSVRSLQSLFRRHLGVSPLEHLHAVRLDAARRELLSGGEPATVHGIAVRWGFANGGRFAREYSARFGELPSDTLRRGI